MTAIRIKKNPLLLSLFSSLKPFLLITTLLGMALISGYLIIEQLWSLPLVDLFASADKLSVSDLAAQLIIMPTMLVAIFSGGLLGVASLLLQQLVKNPLASDTTLAVGSGAQIALLIVTLFLPGFGLYGNFWVAFAGALISMALVFALAMPSRLNPLILILAGLIVNIFVTAVSSLMLVFFSEKALGVMTWGGGVLTQISWDGAKLLAIVSAVMAVILMPLIKPLTLMSLDDRQAKSLGVPVNMVRAMVIVLVAVMTALVVSKVGILSFVGLGSATLVNVLSIRHVGKRLLAGFALGGLLLLITSNIVTLIMQVSSVLIPAGALTGILGAPLIIWIIFRQKRQHVDETTPNLHIERRPFTTWEWTSWCAAVLALLLVALLVTNTISRWQFMTNNATSVDLIRQFRLPRTLSAAATGVMLASAGVLIQTLTRNPMASPEVLGVSSGSAVGVLVSVVLLTMLGLPITLGSMLVSGTLGALAVLLLILWLARTLNPAYLLLVGIAISALMNGVLSVIKLSGDPRLQAILSWLSGTTYSAKPETVWWLMGTALVLSVACFLLIQPLRVLSLGGTVAKSLGVNLRLSQLAIMTVVAGLSAASTLAVGPLSFIGLMVPHLATSLGAVELNRQLPLAMLLGAGLMIVADWLGRYVIFPYEIPAGTIASIIGGAYFLLLMRKLKA